MRKSSQRLADRRVARAVHGSRVVVLTAGVFGLTALAMGCVIPPSLEVDNQDAGINSPPAITAIRLDTEQLAEPGPLNAIRGRGALQVEAIDTDDNDQLFVRIFVNYTVEDPTPPRAQCPAGSGLPGNVTRSCMADITGLCQMSDLNPTEPLLATVRVFDRAIGDSGSPTYQSMVDPAGLTTAETFMLTCTDPQI